mmetsp:Transcript_129737/g.361393  ORF Transcript_129737/g.361393 Transcript_129737/m.361393 type:complete len:239 (-) Transcript_129737:630-1346(-)
MPSVMLEQSSTVPRVIARKASGDFERMTKRKILSSTALPKIKMIPKAMPPRTAAWKSAMRRLAPPPDPARRGTTTNNGTTARSWNSSTPNDARPYGEASWPLSRSSCSAKAEEESASAPPRTTRAPGASEGARSPAKSAISSPVPRYCAPPRPKTSRFMARTFSTESSKPISKRKKMMPSSAKCRVERRLDTRLRPEGPMKTPMSKKPMIGEVFKRRMAGTTSVVASSSSRTSRWGPG